MTAPATPRGRWWALLLLLVGLVALAAHARGVGNTFTFDDRYIVVDNPQVTGPGGLWPILTSHYWAPVDRQGDLYRPLTVATFWLTDRWFGLAPWAYHLGNVLLHAIVSVLVVLVCRRITGSAAAALAAGVLFATHPIHTEAVAGVVGRADLLAALFVLWGWLARRRVLGMSFLFILGLLSKENAIVLPGLLFVEDLAARWHGRSRTVDPKPYAALLAIAAAFVGARMAVFGLHAGAVDGPFLGVEAVDRVLTAAGVLGRYLLLMVAPVGLSADYSYNQIPIVSDPLDGAAWAGLAACMVLLAGAWVWRRRLPGLSAGILIYFVALFPVSNIPFGIGVVMAERLLYLPSLGLCLAAGALIARGVRSVRAIPERRVVAASLLLSCVPGTVLASLSWRRTGDWRDPLTLFTATVRTSPASALAHFGLGSALQDAGRFEEAETAYMRSLAIAPERAETHYNLGTLFEREGRAEEAMQQYREAIRLEPDHARAHNNLGILEQAAGRLDEAVAEYRLAIDADAGRPGVWWNLGTALEAQGRYDEAIRSFREELKRDPDETRCLNNLGRLLTAMGRAGEAVPILERAVTVSGGAPTPTVNLAAALLATGDLERAGRLVGEALASDPDDQAARRVRDAIIARAAERP